MTLSRWWAHEGNLAALAGGCSSLLIVFVLSGSLRDYPMTHKH
jgi:hypothetical protein